MRKLANFYMSEEMKRDLLINEKIDYRDYSNENISFNLIGINRLQSTMICMLKDSYVQQSQRYVKNDIMSFMDLEFKNPALKEKYNELMNDTLHLYNRMTELKEESKGKSRTTKSDYKHGIPIEDARYMLPLTAKTNIAVSMSGESFGKFIDLLTEYKDNVMKDIFENLQIYLEMYGICLSKIAPRNNVVKDIFDTQNTQALSEHVSGSITHDINDDCIDSICIGTLTSTTSSPMNKLREKYPTQEDKEKLINRVAGYGHTSILEQARFNSVMSCSLVTFHQLIRHRMVSIKPLKFDDIGFLTKFDIVVPPTIKNDTWFGKQYIEILLRFKDLQQEIIKTEPNKLNAMYLLTNASNVSFMYTCNVRADIEVMNKRLCSNAQWEIRQMMKNRKDAISESCLGFVYNKFAKPDCLTNKGCQEGAYSCDTKVRENVNKK